MEQKTANGDTIATNRSATIKNILSGLLDVQDKLHVAKNKTGQVGNQKYKYADLAAVWDGCRDLLKAKGMIVVHDSPPSATADSITITATLHHVESGEWMSSSITMKPRTMTPQEIGSAQTYGRRYTLASLVGIVVDDDDDGKKATAMPQTDLKKLKASLREALKHYQGEDLEQIRQDCTTAQNEGKFDLAFVKDIVKRTGIKIEGL